MKRFFVSTLVFTSLVGQGFAQVKHGGKAADAGKITAPVAKSTPSPFYFAGGFTQESIEQVKARREKQLAANQKAVSTIMHDCKLHLAKKDVEGRGIPGEVIQGMGDTCRIDKPSTGLAPFLKDIKNATRGVDQNSIWNDTTNIALEKAVEAMLSLHYRVVKDGSKLSFGQAVLLICKDTPKLCTKGRPELNVIKNAISKVMENQKKRPIKYLDGPTQEVLKKEFNSKVELANQTCALTKQKYYEIKQAHSCVRLPDLSQLKFKDGKWDKEANKKVVIKPVKPMTEMECDIQLEQAYNKHKRLESIARESIKLNMQLLISSELGPLFATKSFRKKVGTLSPDFVYESCMKGDGKVLAPVWQEDINNGRSELYALAKKELQTVQNKRIVPPRYVDKEEELEKYLKTNPLTIAELLKRTKDPVYAKNVCYYIKDIYRSDKISNYIDAGLMTVGVVASIAFGFATGGAGFAVMTPAASALAAISLGSTALVITKNAVDYHEQLREDQANRQSIATKQRELDNGIRALEASDAKKEALLSNMKWSAAGLVLEVVGLGFSLKKAATLVGDLKKAPVLYEMVEGTTTAQKATNLHKGSQTFTKAVKALPADKVGPLKNLTVDQQTKVAAIFSKMDKVKAELMVQKLSKLDDANFKKFFSMVDDVSHGRQTQKALLASLDDFAKTGTPKRVVTRLTPEELAHLGPIVPKDASKVAKVYPNSSRALQEIIPGATPQEVQQFLQKVRKQYGGLVNDDEIALLVERFGYQGAKNSDQLLKKFSSLQVLKQKHPEMFLPDGVMNSAAFKNENELTKLAYLDEIEKNGVPLRAKNGALLLTTEGNVIRKQVSKMTPAKRLEALQAEMNYVAKQNPCSL